MSKRTINISDKLSNEKPVIVIGENEVLFVNNSLSNVFAIEEAISEANYDSMCNAVKLAVGIDGAAKLDLDNKSKQEFEVIITAIMAAVQDVSYEEASERFRKKQEEAVDTEID